jgi:hypothetical protein
MYAPLKLEAPVSGSLMEISGWMDPTETRGGKGPDNTELGSDPLACRTARVFSEGEIEPAAFSISVSCVVITIISDEIGSGSPSFLITGRKLKVSIKEWSGGVERKKSASI